MSKAFLSRDLDLSAYLERIAFNGPARPDLTTLQALHQAHQYAVPFENLDVQLGRPTSLDLIANYNKVVRRRRGGWCYELNGVLAWALSEIGFKVMRVSAGVMREHNGEGQLGRHLCLLVQLDQLYLVDVGFGGSLLGPLPMQVTERNDIPYHVSLKEVDKNYWRYSEWPCSEQTHGEPFGFDFLPLPADENLLAEKCHFLQSDPNSPFVQNLVVQRRSEDKHLSLRGRVLTATTISNAEKTLLNSADEMVAVLQQCFDLDVPEAASLWPSICARHDLVFSNGTY